MVTNYSRDAGQPEGRIKSDPGEVPRCTRYIQVRTDAFGPEWPRCGQTVVVGGHLDDMFALGQNDIYNWGEDPHIPDTTCECVGNQSTGMVGEAKKQWMDAFDL